MVLCAPASTSSSSSSVSPVPCLCCGAQPGVSSAQLDFLRLSLAQTATQDQSWSIVVGHHPPISGVGTANSVLNNAVAGLLAQGK